MVVRFENFRMARTVCENADAPPSGRSSLVTEVITTWRRCRAATDAATRSASPSLRAAGFPCATAQKLQFRVHLSPSIRNVAAPPADHSPLLQHRASLQTV